MEPTANKSSADTATTGKKTDQAAPAAPAATAAGASAGAPAAPTAAGAAAAAAGAGNKPHSICVLRLSALGDCINAFGVLGALKRTYPELELAWVIDQRFAPLFCDDQGHDIIPMLRVDFKSRGWGAICDLRRKIKELAASGSLKNKGQFDDLLNMQTSIKASLCSLALKARNKFGYDQERSREGQAFFVNKRVPSPQNPHVLAGFMAFTAACGYPVTAPFWNFKLDPYLIDRVRCMVSHERVCALAPCSANVGKNWTIDGYVAVAKLAQSRGMSVVLLGGKAQIELDTCAAIADKCPGCLNLCGKTNLRELAAFLSISKILIAPDSGSMHLASALNTPVIGLFARHNDKRVGPWNFMNLNVSVYEQLAYKELNSEHIPWRYRVRQPDAMQQITVEQVLGAVEQALDHYHL